MSSFLTTTTEVRTRTTLAPHIKTADVLSLLHNDTAMLELNPSKLSYTLLPPGTATAFYASVPDAHKPPLSSPGPIAALPVYHITEHASEGEAEPGHWKGGWIKRFVPEELTYQTSVQHTPDGLISITHAPMGVQSVTTWVVREAPGGGGVLDMTGKVWSNRALMGFIRGGLQGSYERLAADFVVALEKLLAEGKVGDGDGLTLGEEQTAEPAGAETTAAAERAG